MSPSTSATLEDGRIDDADRQEEVVLVLVRKQVLNREDRVHTETREAVHQHDRDRFAFWNWLVGVRVRPHGYVQQGVIEAAKLLANRLVVFLDQEGEGDEGGGHDDGQPSSLGELLDD